MAVVDTARWCNRTGLGTAASCWPRPQRWHAKLCAIELNARVGLSARPCGSMGPLLQEENNSCLRRQPPNCVDVVKSLCQRGRLEEALGTLESMEQQGLLLPLEVHVMLLQECGKQRALVEARLVHARLARRRDGLDSHGYYGDQLVGVFVRCGSLPDASLAFRSALGCSVSSWTVVIAAYCDRGQNREALFLYEHLLEAGLEPDRCTFLSVLKACASLLDLEQGRKVHADIKSCRCASDVFVGTALLGMYAKCGSMVDARGVFDTLSTPDVVSWNAMISGYAQQEQGELALELYDRMQDVGMLPNDRTFVSVLKACGNLGSKEEAALVNGQLLKVKSLVKGKQVHAHAAAGSFECDVFVGNTLVDMYVKCRSMQDAQHVFDMLCQRNVVTWNSILTGYARQGEGDKVLQLYSQMQEEGVMPHDRTFVSVLKACGSLAASEQAFFVDHPSVKPACLQKARGVHAELLKSGCGPSLFLGTALVDMYAKCGSMADARCVFDALPQRDVVTWTVLIAGYAQQGQGEKSLLMYSHMQQQGCRPTMATFLSLLKACACIGALDACAKVHHDIAASGLDGSAILATTLIHAYGKCGSMRHAQHVFDSLAEHDLVSWTALFAGYAQQGQAATCLLCFKKMLQSGTRPDAVAFLCALAACSRAGLVEQGLEYFASMVSDGIAASIEHYVALVDLLGGAGLFDLVGELLLKMPMQPSMPFWLCLLSACLKHGNVHFGRLAFEGAVQLESKLGAPYMMMSNIYVRAHMWEDANKVEDLRRRACPWKLTGLTWIEHGEGVHVFVVGDKNHAQREEVHVKLERICSLLGSEGIVYL